ncbi:MAG: hypothetical protein ABJX35_01650 [Hyphomicrobiales bacterium]
MNQLKCDDMVILAYIREQRRLRLKSYGLPRKPKAVCTEVDGDVKFTIR